MESYWMRYGILNCESILHKNCQTLINKWIINEGRKTPAYTTKHPVPIHFTHALSLSIDSASEIYALSTPMAIVINYNFKALKPTSKRCVIQIWIFKVAASSWQRKLILFSSILIAFLSHRFCFIIVFFALVGWPFDCTSFTIDG